VSNHQPMVPKPLAHVSRQRLIVVEEELLLPLARAMIRTCGWPSAASEQEGASVNGRAADNRLKVSELDALADRALERAEAALRDDDPESRSCGSNIWSACEHLSGLVKPRSSPAWSSASSTGVDRDGP